MLKSEEQKEERLKKSEQGLKDLCDTIKWIGICILEFQEEDRERDREYLMK